MVDVIAPLLLPFCVKEFINLLVSNQYMGSWIYQVSDLRLIWLFLIIMIYTQLYSSANGLGDWGSISGRVMPKTKKNGT